LTSREAGTNPGLGFWRPSAHIKTMKAFKRHFLLGLGWLIIVIGLALGPIPGPGGIPIVAAGSVLVLSQSMSARRLFIRMQKRYPGFMGPIRKLLKSRKKKTKDG